MHRRAVRLHPTLFISQGDLWAEMRRPPAFKGWAVEEAGKEGVQRQALCHVVEPRIAGTFQKKMISQDFMRYGFWKSEETAKIKKARRLSLPGQCQMFSGTALPSDLQPQNQQGLGLCGPICPSLSPPTSFILSYIRANLAVPCSFWWLFYMESKWPLDISEGNFLLIS